MQLKKYHIQGLNYLHENAGKIKINFFKIFLNLLQYYLLIFYIFFFFFDNKSDKKFLDQNNKGISKLVNDFMEIVFIVILSTFLDFLEKFEITRDSGKKNCGQLFSYENII